jgi:hypothetical protein
MQDSSDASRLLALRWLAAQLSWERRLAFLRGFDDEPDFEERDAA